MADEQQTRLCRLEDLGEGASLGLTANCGGRLLDIFVLRKHGAVYAYHNSCPHTGAPLDWVPNRFLSLDGRHIQCATHAALFRIEDGFCVAGPCSGQSLTRLEVAVEDGHVCLRAGDGAAGQSC